MEPPSYSDSSTDVQLDSTSTALAQWPKDIRNRRVEKHSLSSQPSVQFSHSVMSNSATPWIAARQASLSITNSRSSPKLMSIESVMPSSHLVLCRPLLLLPPIPPSIRVFSNESALRMRWPKSWSFSPSISASNEHPGLVSFRMDWLDLLAVLRVGELIALGLEKWSWSQIVGFPHFLFLLAGLCIFFPPESQLLHLAKTAHLPTSTLSTHKSCFFFSPSFFSTENIFKDFMAGWVTEQMPFSMGLLGEILIFNVFCHHFDLDLNWASESFASPQPFNRTLLQEEPVLI